MSHPPPSHRAAENGRDMVLDQEVGKALGAITSGEGDHERGGRRMKWLAGR